MTQSETEAKLNDLAKIEFSDSLSEITSTLSVVLTLYEFDDDPEVIKTAKEKLQLGVAYLHQLSDGATEAAAAYETGLRS